MKISRLKIIAFSVVLILLFLFLGKDRSRTLPAGKVTETVPLENLVFSPQTISGRPQIEFNTTKGNFVIELRPDLAPESSINFLDKWSSGYCNQTTFHRVEDWVIQGCDPLGTGLGGKNNLPTENSPESFLAGSVGVARKPLPVTASNDSQIFIVKKDSTFLDGEYTYLGKVISGLDIISELTQQDRIISTTILTK